jgi:hypothetical protein
VDEIPVVVVVGLELLFGAGGDYGGVGVRRESGVSSHQARRREPVEITETQQHNILVYS